MKENDLSFFRLESGEDKIELKRGLDMDAVKELLKAVRVSPAPNFPAVMPPVAAAAYPMETAGSTIAPSGGITPPLPERHDHGPTGPTIDSPMVGTFYRAPAPTEPMFVKEGDRVTKDTVVCIIEAMKVMNEIKAEKSGVIKKVFAEDGNPVQYGEPLFELEA
jgi:acetyl-CoA carboxylase biotin carboxyl carrier protein